MKKFLFALIFPVAVTRVSPQEIAQVSFTQESTLRNIALVTDREVLIRISPDGSVMEWGIEVQSIRSNIYFAPQLQSYMGRIEYYGREADTILNGKVKNIASAAVTYYPGTETEWKRGKIRSIGRLFFDYYDFFDNKVLRGKIRSIGGYNIEYYSSFDDPALVGKLKSVGTTRINYYTSFDDRMIRGKIKSIGPVNYTWFTSLETQYGGGLKSGNFRQSVGGITYIIQ